MYYILIEGASGVCEPPNPVVLENSVAAKPPFAGGSKGGREATVGPVQIAT
jgi:hypothetical protein